ncbi:MAG: hypothetical protein ABSD62_05455 [Candidatus Limnocylindrales bacterium]|jgi:hypothetical protein
MRNPTREWPWPYEGYTTVRLLVGDDILPPTRGQIVSQVEAVVKASDSVKGIEQGIHSIPSPYLPLQFQVESDKDRPDPDQEHVDIEVHVRRR